MLHGRTSLVRLSRPALLLTLVAAHAAPPTPPACAATRPNGSQPPPEVLYSPEFNDGASWRDYRAGKTRPDSSLHGNGMIWTYLPQDGRLAVRPWPDDHALRQKVAWYLAKAGPLTVSGHRLDGLRATRDTVVADVGTSTEPRFRPSYLVFTRPGCWEVTARANGSTLTFVADVARAGD